MPLEEKIAKILLRRKKTVSLAESCSGGLLAHRLTNVSGSSKYFQLGLVTYSYESKEKMLKIPRALLLKHGAVSAQVTTLMASNVRKILNTDFGIGITGIAGPTGATKKKPLGLTYVAISTKTETICHEYIFKGSRLVIKKQATDKALQLFLKLLQ